MQYLIYECVCFIDLSEIKLLALKHNLKRNESSTVLNQCLLFHICKFCLEDEGRLW